MRYLLSMTGLAALTLTAATPALAETAAAEAVATQSGGSPTADEPVGLEEVIVTARRMEENLQEVPVTTTVFSAQKLEDTDTRNFFDLIKSVPALGVFGNRSVSTNGPILSNVTWLRGVPGVIPYFAEVPGAPPGYGAFLDISNVQVLKGPQGTLFGASTNGGAVLFEPRRPSNEYNGYAQATFGRYNRMTFEGAADVPIIEDKLLLRAAIARGVRDGYVRDITTGQDSYDENYIAARVSLTWRPTDAIENRLIFNYSKSDTNGAPLIVLGVNPNGAAQRLYGAALTRALEDQLARGNYVIQTDTPGGSRSFFEDYRFIDTFEWRVSDNLTIRNIASYGENRRLTRGDNDGTPLPLQGTLLPTRIEPWQATWSNELQAVGKLFGGLVDYQAGYFHRGTLRPESNGTLSSTLTYGVSLGSVSAQLPKTTIFTNAVYAEGTFDLGSILEGLKATAGYRRTWDTRTQHSYLLNPTTLALVRENHAKGDFSANSYRLGVNYQVTPDVMLYFTNSKGYSTGGFNLTAPVGAQSYQPESLNNYEAGVKSEWRMGDVQARVNLAGYYGKYDDIQVQQIAIFPGVGQVALIQNAASATIKGFEGEVMVVPNPSFELAANFAYAKAEYDKYSLLNTTTMTYTDLSDSPFVFVPEFKYSLSATWHLPTPDEVGDVSFTADWTHQSEVVTAGSLGTAKPIKGIETMRPRENLDVSLNWRRLMGNDNLQGSLFVTNVLDDRPTGDGVGGLYKVSGLYITSVAPPRMWGVRLQYNFD